MSKSTSSGIKLFPYSHYITDVFWSGLFLPSSNCTKIDNFHVFPHLIAQQQARHPVKMDDFQVDLHKVSMSCASLKVIGNL